MQGGGVGGGGQQMMGQRRSEKPPKLPPRDNLYASHEMVKVGNAGLVGGFLKLFIVCLLMFSSDFQQFPSFLFASFLDNFNSTRTILNLSISSIKIFSNSTLLFHHNN